MFAPSISCRVQPNAQRTPGSPPVNCRFPALNLRRYFPAFTLPRQRDPESIRGFTLLELLIVVGIIATLLVLIAPAFTNMKTGADFTNAVYGIQGLLENARTYAKANNTYVFIGFAEVESSVDPSVNPQVTTGPAPYGRVAVAVVASKDGTRQFNWKPSGQGSEWTANYANGSNLTRHRKIAEV